MLDMAAIELLGTFGKRLTALRKERDQNQGEFAAAVTRRLERAGKKETVSNSFISALESGRFSPSLNVLTAILAELDVSADYLVLGIATGTPAMSSGTARASAGASTCATGATGRR